MHTAFSDNLLNEIRELIKAKKKRDQRNSRISMFHISTDAYGRYGTTRLYRRLEQKEKIRSKMFEILVIMNDFVMFFIFKYCKLIKFNY